ncbi:MAG: GAF domain-containing protein [Pirellulales bacterium]
MTRTIPNYLKLHVEELAAQAKAASASLTGLTQSFTEATGWGLTLPSAPTELRRRVRKTPDAPTLERVNDPTRELPSLELARVKPLAEAIQKVVADLELAQRALVEREAELASAIPVGTLREDARPLGRRLESLLKTAAESVQTRAAAAYLLDDATSKLKLRAHYGLSTDRLFSPARGLRGQAADLEALLGRAVVMNDTRNSLKWKTPEPCGAAVCVPISTPTTPLGTLWLYADLPREFTPLQLNLVEVVAGRIAAELERHAACRESFQLGQLQRQWKLASRWMRARVPMAEPMAAGWDVGAWTPQSEQLSGQFVDWEMLPEGQMVVSLGRAPGAALDAGLSAVTMQTLLKALAPVCRGPRRLVSRVNDTAWRTAAGSSLGSLVHASVTPETGEVELVATGDVGALVVRAASHEWIEPGMERLGETPDVSFRLRRHRLEAGETLMLLGAALPSGDARDSGFETPTWQGRGGRIDDLLGVRTARFSLDALQVADIVRTRVHAGAAALVEGLKLSAEQAGEDQVEPTAILAIHRRSTP